jgi:ATP-dependent DNA helicase RecG
MHYGLPNMADQTSDQKKQWKTKHLRTVCAFANSYGGRLIIGNADSFSPEEALDEARNIYEEISRELDIRPHVRPVENKGKACIVMDIRPSPEPICLDGQYYRRVGKEDRELVGDDLEKFILLKDRRARLDLLMPGASVKDLDKNALDAFRSMAKVSKKVDDAKMLQSLNLMQKDMLRGSAVILFHSNPSQYMVGPDIRIGRFSASGLMDDMEVVSGPAFLQPRRAVELLSSKYLQDVDYPMDAVEEAIINAVAHKDYSSGDPVRIRVYKNRLSISNAGGLSKRDMSPEIEGRSRPANPGLADIFARAGMMRLMGTGIPNMNAACLRTGIPGVTIDASKDDFAVTFTLAPPAPEHGHRAPEIEAEPEAVFAGRPVLAAGDIKDRGTRTRNFRISSLLAAVGDEEVSARELMDRLEFRHRPTFMSNYMEPAIEGGFIERTCDKPTSRNQRYRATEKGLALLR